MNWIDEANKQLEKQRANFQESLDSGEAAKRAKSAGGKIGGKTSNSTNAGLSAKTSGQLLAAAIKGGKDNRTYACRIWSLRKSKRY